jgi:hypothetical protein
MADKKDYKGKLSGFADRLKSEPTQVPMQEVKLAKGPYKKDTDLYHLNVWIPQDLAKRLKLRGVEDGTSLTEITITALEKYLND